MIIDHTKNKLHYKSKQTSFTSFSLNTNDVKDEREFQITAAIDALAYIKTSLCPYKADPGIRFRYLSKDLMREIKYTTSNAWNTTITCAEPAGAEPVVEYPLMYLNP